MCHDLRHNEKLVTEKIRAKLRPKCEETAIEDSESDDGDSDEHDEIINYDDGDSDEHDEIINYVESSDEEDRFQETFGLQPSLCK